MCNFSLYVIKFCQVNVVKSQCALIINYCSIIEFGICMFICLCAPLISLHLEKQLLFLPNVLFPVHQHLAN